MKKFSILALLILVCTAAKAQNFEVVTNSWHANGYELKIQESTGFIISESNSEMFIWNRGFESKRYIFDKESHSIFEVSENGKYLYYQKKDNFALRRLDLVSFEEVLIDSSFIVSEVVPISKTHVWIEYDQFNNDFEYNLEERFALKEYDIDGYKTIHNTLTQNFNPSTYLQDIKKIGKKILAHSIFDDSKLETTLFFYDLTKEFKLVSEKVLEGEMNLYNFGGIKNGGLVNDEFFIGTLQPVKKRAFKSDEIDRGKSLLIRINIISGEQETISEKAKSISFIQDGNKFISILEDKIEIFDSITLKKLKIIEPDFSFDLRSISFSNQYLLIREDFFVYNNENRDGPGNLLFNLNSLESVKINDKDSYSQFKIDGFNSPIQIINNYLIKTDDGSDEEQVQVFELQDENSSNTKKLINKIEPPIIYIDSQYYLINNKGVSKFSIDEEGNSLMPILDKSRSSFSYADGTIYSAEDNSGFDFAYGFNLDNSSSRAKTQNVNLNELYNKISFSSFDLSMLRYRYNDDLIPANLIGGDGKCSEVFKLKTYTDYDIIGFYDSCEDNYNHFVKIEDQNIFLSSNDIFIKKEIVIIQLHNDGKRSKILFFNFSTGKLIHEYRHRYGSLDKALISSDNEYVLLKFHEYNEGKILLLDINHKEEVKEFSLSKIEDIQFYGNNGALIYLLSEDFGFKVEIYNPREERTVCTFNLSDLGLADEYVHSLSNPKLLQINDTEIVIPFSFYNDGKFVGKNVTVKISDCSISESKNWLTSKLVPINQIGYKDGFFIYSDSDGSFKIFDYKENNWMGSLYLFGKEWVFISKQSFFDGSQEGLKNLSVKIGYEVVPIDNYFDKYYTPGLMQSMFEGTFKPDSAQKLAKLSRPPKVNLSIQNEDDLLAKSEDYGSIREAKNKSIQLNYSVSTSGSKLDEIRIFHNGKAIDVKNSVRGVKSLNASKSFNIELVDGKNTIELVAFNSDRVQSLPGKVEVYFDGDRLKPTLHIVTVAINTYKNNRYNLNYALNDAKKISSLLSISNVGIYKEILVHEVFDQQATKSGILQALSKVEKNAKQKDVVVFYYAGHGMVTNKSPVFDPEFYIVPYDITQIYENDSEIRQKAVSAKELVEISTKIKAQKQLFLFDACQSGGAEEAFAFRGAAEEKALLQLARSTGIAMMAASGSEQFATEVEEIGHGIFTYSIIEALSGKADGKNNDKKITVSELRAWIDDQIPSLTKKYRGETQYPVSVIRGNDFPVSLIIEN